MDAKYPKSNRPRNISAYNCLIRNYPIINALPFPIRVLDIGCNAGDTSKFLTYFNNVIQIVAIDKASDAVAIADCFNDDSRIRYELADIENFDTLPKSSECAFDLATSFESFHGINRELALRNLRKALKKGGYFLCTSYAKKTRRDLDLDEFLHQSKKWRQYVPKSQSEFPWADKDPVSWYGNMLKKIGFNVERCEMIEEKITVSNEEALEYLKSSRLCQYTVPESESEEFLEQAFRAYTKSCIRMSGGYMNWSFYTLDVMATKID